MHFREMLERLPKSGNNFYFILFDPSPEMKKEIELLKEALQDKIQYNNFDQHLEIFNLPKEACESSPKTRKYSKKNPLTKEEALEALERCGWNQKAASMELGISPFGLSQAIKRLHIVKPNF